MSGTFALIEKKVDRDGTCLAYKTYDKSHGKMVLLHCQRELWALKKLQSVSRETLIQQHVIPLLDCQETSSCFQLILPFYDSTLYDHLGTKNIGLGHEFILQISQGLLFLHEHDIIHCDLSPSNILMDVSGQMVISDFGCAHSIRENETEIQGEVGTRYYKAPEHLFGSKLYRFSTDVWSFGAIFVELLLGYTIFAGESDIEQIGRIVNRLGKPSPEVEQEEMCKLPDANKLMFFTSCASDDEEEYEFDSDDEDYDLIMKSRIPLTKLLEEEGSIVSNSYKQIILGTLTWSVKNRLTMSKIVNIIKSNK